MTNHTILSLSCVLLLSATLLAADPAGSPLSAKWEYSRDGGKTFTAQPSPVPVTGAPTKDNAVIARASFTIDDPAKIGAVRLVAASGTGAFALTDADSVQRRYIGAAPTVVNLRLTVNGKATDAGHFPSRLYNAITIDPALLVKGANTLTASGVAWATPAAKGPVTNELRLETLPGDLAVLDRGPTLGDIGEDYFCLTARAVVASEFTVSVKPVDPAGPETTQKFASARLLRAKAALPKGTKKFSYSLTVRAPAATKTYGPFEVVVPTYGVGLRFVVAGNTYIYSHHPAELQAFFAKMQAAKPQFFVHTGVFQNVASHDGAWTVDFFHYSREALSRIPMLAVPGYPDLYSPEAFGQEFYFPTVDGVWNFWTKSMGKVRLIGIDAVTMCEDGGRGIQWLEETLKGAKEDYILVFNSQLPFSSGQNAKYYSKPAVEYSTKTISPLLAKYKATAMLGSYHYVYERSEPAAGEGVTSIMTAGAGGLGWPLRQDMREANKASKVAVGYKNHYCLFEVAKDSLQMQAVAYETGDVIDKVSFPSRNK